MLNSQHTRIQRSVPYGFPYTTQGGFPTAWVAGVGSMGNGYMDLLACDRCGLTDNVPTITAHSIITLRLSRNQFTVRRRHAVL